MNEGSRPRRSCCGPSSVLCLEPLQRRGADQLLRALLEAALCFDAALVERAAGLCVGTGRPHRVLLLRAGAHRKQKKRKAKESREPPNETQSTQSMRHEDTSTQPTKARKLTERGPAYRHRGGAEPR
eukprot:7386698-Prymnesium_polylepis.3